MNKKKIGFLLTFFFLSILLLSACGSSESTNEQPEEGSGEESASNLELNEEGVFHFVASGEFKPFSYFDENGELTGFDVEIGKALAEEMGLEAKAEATPFSGMIAGINADRFDAAVASMGITEERAQKVDFSDPYYISGAQVFTRPDSDIQGLDDLNDETEVAVGLATTYETLAKDYTTNIQTYDSDVTALRALDQGEHDAVITDLIVGEIAIEESGFSLEPRGEVAGVDEMAVAVKKGDENLLQEINRALEAIKENGTYLEISEKYFGRDISKQPES
ncbi:transporter substrate-binding domain-containing protein [Bacillus taeanensis]|uniref:Amino acid ABC transporter substrate-binding protein n=1 Tax=Bacillus taeanensis TaxID=273032 RepID=A0A366Y5T6_9BACI|nr:transporter substrate-binding domain-containing protein [Bacillus taeanensis]RBW71571.1 amino acid ABC transporter substrate-binding protein [Bacillus taeanensis]